MDGSNIARIQVPVAVPEAACHSLPCIVETTGPAPVSEYFFPRTVGDSLKASFRGRELTGCVVAMPTGYTALALAPRDAAAHTQGCAWDAVARSSDVTCWTHGPGTGSDSGLARALEWVELAAQLHANVGDPVPPEIAQSVAASAGLEPQ